MTTESLSHDAHDRQHVSAARFAAVRALAVPLAIGVAAFTVASVFGPFFIYLGAFAPLGVVAGFGRDAEPGVVWRTGAIALAAAAVVALLVWGALHQYGPWAVVIALFGGYPLGTFVGAVWGAVAAYRHALRMPVLAA